MEDVSLHAAVRRAVGVLADDLGGIFGARLRALVLHGVHARARRRGGEPPAHPIETLALVDTLEYRDLAACADRAGPWRARRLAMPLLLPEREFDRSLDVFPLEYGDIIAEHVVLVGRDPFAGMRVAREDLRRACETQVRSHAIHLREGFLESGGEPVLVARLLVSSAPSFATLVATLARLAGADSPDPAARAAALDKMGVSASVAERLLALEQDAEIAPDEAARLFPPYLDLVQALVRYVDTWAVAATS